MCIILACESNRRPSEDVLQTCWLYNPDGAGIAYPEGGGVHVEKGLMSYDEFAFAYAAMPYDVPCLIHFRIGTSGGTDPATMAALTHPFGVCSDLERVLYPDGAPLVMAHNGILPYTQVGGKILYRTSDIEKTLMKGYKEAYRYKRS